MSKDFPKKAFKSKHIFPDSTSPPISGYILLEGSKFSDIIPFSDLSAVQESHILSTFQVFDFSDSYIMPGIIDLNVYTNSTFLPEWSDVENLTKQAVQGGVTTILDNPIMGRYDENFEETQALQLRKKALEGNVYTDCGMLAYLGPDNFKKMEEIFKDPSVIGFKAYMSPPFQTNMSFLNKETLGKIALLLRKNPIPDFFLSIHPEKASLRDLFLSSPLRNVELERRLDPNVDITNSEKFGGGIHGEMSSSDDSNKSDKSSESEEEISGKEKLKQIVPNTAFLRKRAQKNDKLREEQNIHKQEISEYYFNEEEKEIMKNLQSSDSEVEYQNETTSSSSQDEDEFKENEMHHGGTTQKTCVASGFKARLTTFSIIKTHNNLDFDKKDASFAKNPLISNIRATLGVLKSANNVTNSEIEGKDEATEGGEAKRERKASGLLQRRKVANSAILGTKESDQLKNFQISIRKNEGNTQGKPNPNNKIYENFLYNHSLSWETNGVKTVLKIFKEFNSGHIVLSNLSSLSLAFLVREPHKSEQKHSRIFCETSIPFLYFDQSMIKRGQCKFKISPPIRDSETRKLLMEGLKVPNLFHAVSSFHMSVPRKFKTINGGDFKRCFNGVSCLGMNLQVVWSKSYSKEKFFLKKYRDESIYDENILKIFQNLVRLLSESPAEIAFLKNKGKIKKGFDADFFVWNPFEMKEYTDKEINLKNKKGYLFRKQKLYGVVKSTFLRGEEVYSEKPKRFYKKGIIFNKEMDKIK